MELLGSRCGDLLIKCEVAPPCGHIHVFHIKLLHVAVGEKTTSFPAIARLRICVPSRSAYPSLRESLSVEIP